MFGVAGAERDQTGPASIERLGQAFVRRRGGGCLGEYHEIDGQPTHGRLAKALTDESLESVAIDGAPGVAFADCDAESRRTELVRPRDDGEELIGRACAGFEDAVEIGRRAQSVIAPEPALTAQTCVRRLRPLARRAFNTRRPPRVLRRARKPWVRTRLSLLGW